MLDTQSTSEKLVNYLQKEIKQHQQSALVKGFIAHLLFWCVIVTSSLGLFSTFSDKIKLILPVLVIIPGIALVIANTFKYEARSKWHKLKQRKLEALCNKLMYEDASASEISKEMNVVLEELDKVRTALEKPLTSK